MDSPFERACMQFIALVKVKKILVKLSNYIG